MPLYTLKSQPGSAALITVCVGLLYYTKNAAHFVTLCTLLQNAANVITICVTYYKMRCYYKMPQNIPFLNLINLLGIENGNLEDLD